MTVENTDSKLYLYYQNQGILPTYARFAGSEELQKYQQLRAHLFLEKLCLPPKIFRGSRLVEFGPDSGENSLIFAKWGAEVTLVEPNPNAWMPISNYFEKFGLSNQLQTLAKVSLQDFETSDKFDFIDAEGFIYTIKPDVVWINLFSKILAENGFLVLSYYETFGCFLELILKLINARAKSLTGLDSKEIAWKLFEAKWNSIPHTRSFESWVMDVLDNPYVRLKYLFNLAQILPALAEASFSLYSSWPIYSDSLSFYWHKKVLPPEQKLKSTLAHTARSCLSFAFGKKLFLCSESTDPVQLANEVLINLLTVVDNSLDEFHPDILKVGSNSLAQIKNLIKGNAVLADAQQDKEDAIKLIESVQQIFNFLVEGDIDRLITFCNSDPAFISFWGLPCHFAVFKKGESST